MLFKRLSNASHEKELKKPSLKDFELIKVIGKGCMGKVLLARLSKHENENIPSNGNYNNNDNNANTYAEYFAIKVISKSHVLKTHEQSHILTEQKILSQVSAAHSHPFLIHLFSSFQDTENLYLIMEYTQGGDLATQLSVYGKLGLERSLFYASEIVLGISELHRLGVIYRDLKPENVLLDVFGHIKLTDFGLSKQKVFNEDGKTSTFCGTAEYLAPEILLEQLYSFEVDWWSFGTLLYEMITGYTPFWAENHQRMYQRILHDNLEFPPEFTDYYARDLISKLLIRDPVIRLGNYSVIREEGIKNIMSHPYFAYDFEMVLRKEVKPPYVPKITGDGDLRWFDDEFLKMTPKVNSVDSTTGGVGLSLSVKDNLNKFDGYTYVSTSAKKLLVDAYIKRNNENGLSYNKSYTILNRSSGNEVDENNCGNLMDDLDFQMDV